MSQLTTQDRGVIKQLGILTVLWLVAAIIGGVTGVFDQPNKPPLLFGLFLTVPILGFVAAYLLSERWRLALNHVPLSWITGIHIARFVGGVFLLYVINHTFPAEFGLPAGLGDIISAIVAIPLTMALAKGHRSSSLRWRYIAWNIFGLTDLLLAVTNGLLYSDSVLGMLRHDLSTAALANLPINLIPTFYVPGLILLHFLALRRNAEVAKIN